VIGTDEALLPDPEFETLPRTRSRTDLGGGNMLGYVVLFLLVALIAAFLGFGALAGLAASIAKILFIVALILLAFSLVMGRRPSV